MFHQRNKHKIIHLSQTTSTNSYAKKYMEKHQAGEGTIIVAHEQTSGRGYGKNTWESEPGKNLTFSLILYPSFMKASNFFRISQFVSLGLVDVLEKHLSEGISIKWPNDIYYKDDKISGILIENSILGNKIESSVIGIGLNVNQEAFAHAPNPVSLKQITGKEYDLEILLDELFSAILSRYEPLKNGKGDKIHQDYTRQLYRFNKYHYFKTVANHAGKKRFRARIVNVSSDGKMELQAQNGQKMHFGFKEVEYEVD